MSINLFQPCDIGRLEIRNRFVRSATWDATADSSGAATEKSVALYKELAKGDLGLIVTGFAFVSPLGQAVRGQYGAHTDAMIPGLRRIAEVAHEGGANIAVQLVHAGLNSGYVRWRGMTPLAVSEMESITRPHREMTNEDIEAAIADFTSAAQRVVEAGFDAIQLHGAHGYLMSQFLSPLYNRRIDEWGGSAENRRRFHLEVVRRIRKAVGRDFPLMIKFGVSDDREGGLPLTEGLETARELVAAGIDAIEVSVGVGDAAPTIKEGEADRAYFRERAASVKRAVMVPVILVGGIRSLQMARGIIESGEADLVSMCRPLIREPGLVGRWRSGDEKPAKCISCNKCFEIVRRGEMLECGEERRLRAP
jgi:2,4-dienoyl-CoA reductase-like NADH-dependent reductase (Old Yellow Enzyme family)